MDLLQTCPPIPTILDKIAGVFPAAVMQRRVFPVINLFYKRLPVPPPSGWT